MSDEDDEVAIAGDMEAEVKPGQAEPAGASDDGEDEFDAAGPPIAKASRTIPRGQATREALAKVVAAFKSQRAEAGIDESEEDGDFGSYDEGTTPRESTKVMPAAQSTSASVASPTLATPPPTAPPAPSLDPEVQRIRKDYETKIAELAAREKDIETRERTTDVRGFRDAYVEKPIEALREWFKARGIVTTDEEWKDEVADLVTDLSGQVLGVPLPSEIKNKIEAKRALRAVKAHRSSLGEKERELDERRKQDQQSQDRSRAVEALGKELAKEEHAKQYPWLLAEENAGALVVEVVEAQLKRDGTLLKWTDAAQRANDYLKTQAVADYERRRHLLDTAKASSGKQTSAQQGDPAQDIRRSRTLTNAAAADSPIVPAAPPARRADGKWSNEAHRKETKRRMREAFKTGQ